MYNLTTEDAKYGGNITCTIAHIIVCHNVVVPKDSGAVQICVDLKPLNENVLHKVHPMPKVEITLLQLSCANLQ